MSSTFQRNGSISISISSISNGSIRVSWDSLRCMLLEIFLLNEMNSYLVYETYFGASFQDVSGLWFMAWSDDQCLLNEPKGGSNQVDSSELLSFIQYHFLECVQMLSERLFLSVSNHILLDNNSHYYYWSYEHYYYWGYDEMSRLKCCRILQTAKILSRNTPDII